MLFGLPSIVPGPMFQTGAGRVFALMTTLASTCAIRFLVLPILDELLSTRSGARARGVCPSCQSDGERCKPSQHCTGPRVPNGGGRLFASMTHLAHAVAAPFNASLALHELLSTRSEISAACPRPCKRRQAPEGARGRRRARAPRGHAPLRQFPRARNIGMHGAPCACRPCP